MKIPLGDHVTTDLRRLIVSRMLVQASSGSGKSWALRRILEQTYGHVQQIIIDPEDDFYTLREKFDYILVRHDDGDCVPEVRSAELLATRLLELGVSAIVGLYELHPRDRREFVKRFVNSLVNAPKKLWHHTLIAIDEAHDFCPEQGKGTKKDESYGCAEAVIGLMAKGRKRGFCGLLATQRISKLNKDAAAEAKNKLIGGATIDVDRKRAAEELGFTTKEQILSLRNLEPGEFYAFGPAISRDVIKFTIGSVQTTHPEAGAAPAPVPAAKSKAKSVLAKLADLPQEAEQERVTIAELQHQVAQLRREKGELAKTAPKPETKVEAKTIYALKDSQIDRLEKLNRQFEELFVRQGKRIEEFSVSQTTQLNALFARRLEIIPPINEAIAKTKAPNESLTKQTEIAGTVATPAARARQQMVPARASASGATGAADGDCALGKKVERALLTALAQRPDKSLTKQQVLIFADYRRSGDTDQAFRKFIACGFAAEEGDGVTVTPEGIGAVSPFAPLPTGEKLRSQMLSDSRLKKVERELLRVLFESYPTPVSKEGALERANYKRSGDTDQAFRKFVTAGWATIAGRGEFKAAEELFEE